jgi:hypothetical protein
MSRFSSDAWLGVGVIAFGAFLFLVLIPVGVTSPGNVRIAVLSPTIWPNILAFLLMLIGGLMTLRALIAGPEKPREPNAADNGWRPWARIAATGALMAALFLSLPVLGMPIVTGLMLLAYAVLVRAGRPVATVLTAILLPLMIYGFFSKIAGVPIPQGQLVRLP